MVETLWEGFGDIFGEGIQSLLESILNATLFKLFYYIERALCQLINILYQMFEVFSGQKEVMYAGERDYLINVFFNNKIISNIYWAMAAIGMVLTIGFTIWAVVKKMFDISDREQRSLGQIITAAIRSIVIIVGLTLIMNAVIYATNILMQQVNFVFNNARDLDTPDEKVFTDEEYAAMGRVFLTIGNYSIVNSSNNRYNINSCYNAIRPDMYFLQQKGVFKYDYYDTDKDGNVKESWQSILSKIAKSANLSKEMPIDQYNEDIVESITAAIKYLQENKIVRPVESVPKSHSSDEPFHLDREVFLMGTLNAAKNPEYNKAPSTDDALRGAYYFEKGKTIYNLDNVMSDFDIGFKTDYLLVWLMAVACIFDLVVIIMNCVARIFNMIFLYVIAPPIIAASPLDQGGKFKQWTTAFLIQALSVFGTIIAMRLLDVYLPIVMDPALVLFEDSKYMNMFAKFILVFGGFEVAKKATGLLTGILADSAGWQSIQAGDMSASAGKAIGTAIGAGKAIGGAAIGAGKLGLSAAGLVTRPLTNKITQPFKNAYDKWNKLGTGGQQARNEKAIQDKVAQGKYQEDYLKRHPEDRKYLDPNYGRNNDNNNNNNNQQNQNPNQQNQNPNQHPNQNRDNNDFVPPALPERYRRGGGDENARMNQPGAGARNLRHRFGFDEPLDGQGGQGGGQNGQGGQGGGQNGQDGQGGGQDGQGGQGGPGGQGFRQPQGNRNLADNPQQGNPQQDNPQQGNPPQGNNQQPRPPRRRAGSFSQGRRTGI